MGMIPKKESAAVAIECHEDDITGEPVLYIQQATRKGIKTPLVVGLTIEDAKVAYKALTQFLVKHERSNHGCEPGGALS